MSSPVTGSDFIVASAGESLCTRLTRLLSLSAKLKTWFDWAFTSGGDAQNSLKAMFLPPPGTVWAYHSSQPFNNVKTLVESFGLDVGDTGGPFWRVCDGTNGTPDIRGRVIVGVGSGTGLTVRNPNDVFGEEATTLTVNQIPAHNHPVAIQIPGYGGEDGQRQAPDGGTDTANITNNTSVYTSATLDPKVQAQSLNAGGGQSHNNVQPSVALYYIIRTARLA